MVGIGDLSNRVRHLEDLVLSLRKEIAGRQREGAESADTCSAIPDDDARQEVLRRPPQNIDATEDYAEDSTGRMLVGRVGTRWVDATHWQAILDDITELKDFAEPFEHIGDETGDETRDSTFVDAAADGNHGPTLLVGVFPPVSQSELLTFLPPRAVVDRLVSRYFNSKEPSIVILHVPTFYREYTQFWDNPREVSVVWVGLLYTILCCSVASYYRAGDILPGALGESKDIIDAYRTRAVQCLVLADYTTLRRYTVETLVLYLGTEFIRSSETQFGISVILGVIVRLAMHMGYHRDSKRHPSLSVFDGEMRRRVWALISQIDHLVAFQAGLPRIIPDLQCDTELPRNLLDDDFDEATKVLPVSRPATERTPITYTIMKGMLMPVFGQIVEKTCLARSTIHEEVLRLDKQLQDVHASLPPFLHIRTMNLSITDPPDLIMQRYNLELLYQKSRCVLHRQYLTVHRSDLRYAYSRWTCVDAAMHILQHQNDIYQETLPGGQLYKDKWYISSLTTHDFLMAAMILCLELSCKSIHGPQNLQSETINTDLEGRDELLQTLQISYHIWIAFSKTSKEAWKASKALEVMLHNAKRGHHSQGGEQLTGDRQLRPHVVSPGVSGHRSSENSQSQMFVSGETYSRQTGDQYMARDSSLWAIEGMADTVETFDWYAWDNQIQHDNGEVMSGTWMDSSAAADFQSPWFPHTTSPRERID
ncbi:hypothetical protein B7463_g11665, partial [Scytalidium lignicola]